MTAASWSGRGRATRNVPATPKLARSRTITPAGAASSRSGRSVCTRTQLASVSGPTIRARPTPTINVVRSTAIAVHHASRSVTASNGSTTAAANPFTAHGGWRAASRAAATADGAIT